MAEKRITVVGSTRRTLIAASESPAPTMQTFYEWLVRNKSKIPLA